MKQEEPLDSAKSHEVVTAPGGLWPCHHRGACTGWVFPGQALSFVHSVSTQSCPILDYSLSTSPEAVYTTGPFGGLLTSRTQSQPLLAKALQFQPLSLSSFTPTSPPMSKVSITHSPNLQPPPGVLRGMGRGLALPIDP